MKPARAPVPLLACSLLLGAGAAIAQETAPAKTPGEIGAAYSELEMRAKLAVTPDSRCEDDECIAAQAFRTRVLEIGQRVSDGAYSLAFESNLQLPNFLITVPGKNDIGTLSSGTGSIVVFDGLRSLRPQDPLLAFLIAREMAHIMAGHHEDNSYISLGISIAVSLLFPVANVLRGVEVAASSAIATSSLASTAVSMAGSRIVRGLYKADQQRKADTLALDILAHAGWTAFEVAEALQASMPLVIGEGWMAELRESRHWLDHVAVGPPLPGVPDIPLLPTQAEAPASAPAADEEVSVQSFEVLLAHRPEAHEQDWGLLWRQGEWRSELTCRLLPQVEPEAGESFDEPEEPVVKKAAPACSPKARAAKRCVVKKVATKPVREAPKKKAVAAKKPKKPAVAKPAKKKTR